MLGLDAYPDAPLWRMSPSEVVRRYVAHRDAANAAERSAWTRHANSLAFHASTDKRPVTAADVYPQIFGPGAVWGVPRGNAGGERTDSLRARLEAEEAAVQGRAAEAGRRARAAVSLAGDTSAQPVPRDV